MNQAMKEIRKSCQDNVNQLGQTYRAMYDEIEKKLRRNVHAGEAQESALLDFSSMLLEAEAAGLTKDEIFPDGLDCFYEEFLEALPMITKEDRKRKKRLVGMSTVAIMVAVVLCVFGSKCVKMSSNTYVEGQDHPYMYQSILMNTTSYVKGKEEYFFIRGKYLYRFDPKTKKVSSMCTQEDCKHARQPDEYKYDTCNANVVGDSITNLNVGYHDGYVYYIAYHNKGSYYSLNRVKEDGSEGELVKRWDKENLDPWRWIIHRGYLYYLESQYETVDKQSVMHYYIKRISLQETKQEETVFYEKLSGRERSRVYSLQAYGNGIYFVNYETDGDSNYSSTTLYRYDLRTKNVEEISVPKEYGDRYVINITFLEDQLYMVVGAMPNAVGGGDKFLVADLDGSNIRALPIKQEGSLHADEKYLYVFSLRRMENESILVFLDIYDVEGMFVDHVCLDYSLWDFEQTSIGGEDGILLIDPVDERKAWDIYWIDKKDINNWKGHTLQPEPVDSMHYGYAYTRYLTQQQELYDEVHGENQSSGE